ncbi:L,D-transpeptidase [Amycolatopsis sp. EV170708-02-1]|uniref:L,D-transpeptidase n=1 Tax=Amycolatopsis sp. EV170708-02-1 TaxID=2919322 RepID=UPI001F0BB131|nr:L,D-transpeptidase [Amycolatopsis sp. EV170708-02-1]UMP03201.1 L,D-transpeptidase [Amycolatopsis sp. EV170708-02-1]
MKKFLVGVTALATALVLTACSGNAGGSAPGGGAVAQGDPSGAPTTTSAPSSTPATSSQTPTPSSSSSTPKPTSSKPKPTPKPTPKPAANAADVPCKAALASPGVSACVDLSALKTWLLQDGKVIYGPVKQLPGKKGYATPTGVFHVSAKVKNYHSKQFDAPMPNSVFFLPGIAFHTGSLSVYSHGCIHLSAAASQKYFTTLQKGDVVQVVP